MPSPQEVVLFYGPPFAGKTLYFMCKLAHTHVRVCPKKVFEEDPEATGLRAVIVKVLEYLRKGRNVVIDDENSSRMTRESYVTQIRRKFPHCCFQSIVFKTLNKDSYLQYQWAQEWYMAQQFLSPLPEFPLGNDAKKSENLVKKWFEQAVPPSENEGVAVTEVQLNLMCHKRYKFELPGLFVEWGGIVDGQDAQMMGMSDLTEALNKWTTKNPYGRIVVIHNGRHTCKAAEHLIPGINQLDVRQVEGDRNCGCLLDLKSNLCVLTEKISTPVYFVFVENTSLSGAFSKFPHPGMLAWLQSMHNIDLTHRATLYVYSTDAHFKAAVAVGVKAVKAKKVLDTANVINAIHYGGSCLQIPGVVRNAIVASFDSDTSSLELDVIIPLYQEAIESSEELGHSRCVTMSRGFGRIHGLCYQNASALERYQALYKSVATPTQQASCLILHSASQSREAKTVQPKRVLQDRQAPLAQSSSLNSTATSSVETNPCTIRTNLTKIKLLETDDIRSHAFSTTRFDRGLACSRGVRDLQTAIASEGLWIECKCAGSQGAQYCVSALIDQQGIKEASCTCQDQQAAGKLGKCKHAVGMLIKYQKNQEELKHGTTVLKNLKRKTTGKCADSHNEPSMPPVCKQSDVMIPPHGDTEDSRSLPKWMVEGSQNASLEEEKKRKERTSSFFGGKKRSKRQKRIEKTVYCMTEEELLGTAQMILEERNRLHVENLSVEEEKGETEFERPMTEAVDISCSLQLESTSLTSLAIDRSLQQDAKESPIVTPCTDTGNATALFSELVHETLSFVPETAAKAAPSTENDSVLQSCNETQNTDRDTTRSGKTKGERERYGQKLQEKFGKSILDDLI